MCSEREYEFLPRPTEDRPENALVMPPFQARALFRRNAYTGFTSGFCHGYGQTNVLILSKDYADYFEELCKRNSGALPLLYHSQAGQVGAPPLAVDSDIRTDLPRYNVYKNGCLIGEVLNLQEFDPVWKDYVTFHLGCSTTFDIALAESGVNFSNILDVPFFPSNVPLHSVGPFKGNVIVSMRIIPKHQVEKAFMISSQYPGYHGAPVHIGDPSRIGIYDTKEVQNGDIPMFWACGVTVQEAISSAQLDLAFSHYPGSMFITDVKVKPIPLDDTVEIVQLSRPDEAFFASVINHYSLNTFEKLEQVLINEKQKTSGFIPQQSSLLKATLVFSHAQRVAVTSDLQVRGSEGKVYCRLPGILALCQALLTLGKEVTLIVNEEVEKLYISCNEHMGREPEVNKLIISRTPVSSTTYDCILCIQSSDCQLCQGDNSTGQKPKATTIYIDDSNNCPSAAATICGDCHILTGEANWAGYALAGGLYVASSSPFHWRYRNFAVNADMPPQFDKHTFLPTAKQATSLWKHLMSNIDNSKCHTELSSADYSLLMDVDLKKLLYITALL